MEEHIQYHEGRAARELSLGLSASCAAAAKAHLQLSSMHREQVRLLTVDDGMSKPPLIMG
jgi:hypothetical protein